ncbi:MAG: hypothetical protein QOF37_989, partial [Thermoleophilaceae bacterium]|nr:hypothetical protein [Thermoleophilaceae bacterium]
DDKTASIVFMGVGDAGKSAVFFVSDPAFTPTGEGECNDKKDCRFVKLTLDAKKNEETFTSLDGSIVYKLKLVKLNREMISGSKAKGKTTFKAPALNLGKDAVAGSISQASDAVLPRLLDLPAVATETK